MVWLVLIGLAQGCGPKPKPSPPPLRVVVGSYLLADLVRQVGGDLVDVRWAAESGQPYERFVPDRGFLQAVGEADIVIVGSLDEPWSAERGDPAYQPDRYLSLSRLRVGEETRGALWLDPRIASALIQPLANRIVAQRPGQAKAVRERAEELRRRLDALVGETSSYGAAGTAVLAFDHRFDPLLLACGYRPSRVDCQPIAPRDADVQAMRAAASSTGAKALIVSADLPSAAIEEWGRRTGLRVVPLEALGRPGAGSYEVTLRENLRQLRKHAPVRDVP